MAYIVKRTFGAEGERLGIGLQSEEFIRRLSIGNTWTNIRLCIRYAIVPPPGLGQIDNTRFFMGVCSGLERERGYFSANTRSAFGIRQLTGSEQDTPNYLTYTANAGFPYYRRNTNSGFAQWHYGSSFTNVNFTDGPNGEVPTVYGSALQRRAFMCVDIRKPGSPGGDANLYSIRTLGTSQVSTGDQDTGSFMQNVLKSGNWVGGQTITVGTAKTFTAPVSETEAPLDCITLTWEGPVAMEYYDILVYSKYGIQ